MAPKEAVEVQFINQYRVNQIKINVSTRLFVSRFVNANHVFKFVGRGSLRDTCGSFYDFLGFDILAKI